MKSIQLLILKIEHSISEFMMSINCRGELMENHKACMEEGVAISSMIIGALYNTNLSTIEGVQLIL